jgi:pimeloyl-ACP methyl ester carboxylesterase
MAGWRLPAWRTAGDEALESVAVGGRRIHYVVRGAGEPVVLIHGLGGSWRWWERNIDALAERHRVYALDLGRRERWLHGQGRVRPAEAAEALAGWMAGVGLTRAHVVGHSLGGHMAIRLAAVYPALVDRLVLVAAAGLLYGANLWGLTARAFGPVPERTREFRRLVIRDSLRTNPLVVFQTARELVHDDLTGLVRRVAAPTLIIWGGRDAVVPPANGYALRDAIPGARLFVIPHAGHNPMFYHAGTFNRLVLDFLAKRPER